MSRLTEILLGLPRGFLAREGELSVRFNPVWPWQEVVGAGVWNAVIGVGLVWLVVWVYRRDGRSKRGKVVLGGLRLALMGLVLVLLNRPVVTLTQSRTEGSVVAVLVDDSLSMKVRDVAVAGGAGSGATTQAGAVGVAGGVGRLEAVVGALGGEKGLLAELGKEHTVKLFRFGGSAEAVGAEAGLAGLKAEAGTTAVVGSVVGAVGELAGQRLAGVVVLSDGRDSPARASGVGAGEGGEGVGRLRELGVKVFGVEVGSDVAPRNLAITNVVMQDSAFKGEIGRAHV